MQDELEEAAKEIEDRQERDKKKMIEELGTNLGQYIIKGEWEFALSQWLRDLIIGHLYFPIWEA